MGCAHDTAVLVVTRPVTLDSTASAHTFTVLRGALWFPAGYDDLLDHRRW